ncbi:hypothetical protein MPSEU_000749200 [Mayamaea pseudoterrestris]|nr:hypothetical protein MPSEU_000749200 [Mayamaea pseudoterrestris]
MRSKLRRRGGKSAKTMPPLFCILLLLWICGVYNANGESAIMHSVNDATSTPTTSHSFDHDSSAFTSIISACFKDESDSSSFSSTAESMCWAMRIQGDDSNGMGVAAAGTLCLTLDESKQAFIVTVDTTETDWRLDEFHVWIGARNTYPRVNVNVETDGSSSKPQLESFPIALRGYKDEPISAIYTTLLPFAQTGSLTDMTGQVAACASENQLQAVYQLLARTRISKDSKDPTVTVTDAKWAVKTNFTLSCQCLPSLAVKESSRRILKDESVDSSSTIKNPGKPAVKQPVASVPRPTMYPSRPPTIKPTMRPTRPPLPPVPKPTMYPSRPPTIKPTMRPTRPPLPPVPKPTMYPSREPTVKPTMRPTRPPVPPVPKPTMYPSREPTVKPTMRPVGPRQDNNFDNNVETAAFPSSAPRKEVADLPRGAPRKGEEPLSTEKPFSAPESKATSLPKSAPVRKPTLAPSAGPLLQPVQIFSSTDTQKVPTLPPAVATDSSSMPTQAPVEANPTADPTCHPPTDAPAMEVNVDSPRFSPGFDGSSPSSAPVVVINSPFATPTSLPTLAPAISATMSPTLAPTGIPSAVPTHSPTDLPTVGPTIPPTSSPSGGPTASPTVAPTLKPSALPTKVPTGGPTASPTELPTVGPTLFPTSSPTAGPTSSPTALPTGAPTNSPSRGPTASPSAGPTSSPTTSPSAGPTSSPTASPTGSPTLTPTTSPSAKLTASPTISPSGKPTASPTFAPSAGPTAAPTTSSPTSNFFRGIDFAPEFDFAIGSPADAPSAAPFTSTPTSLPTAKPTSQPTETPSVGPTASPTAAPTKQPSKAPTKAPTAAPTKQPSKAPTKAPTAAPTKQPSKAPTKAPTAAPTKKPSKAPTKAPTAAPTKKPSKAPTKAPTAAPTKKPSKAPTKAPTAAPTKKPSKAPTKAPTAAPTKKPTKSPTNTPTKPPTRSPVKTPVKAPTKAPTFSAANCGPSVRRAWHDTSCADQAAYLRAVELLYKLPATNTYKIPNYATFAKIHASTLNKVAHGSNDGPFLPWHRWYLWKYEKALQTVSGTCLTVPYWDWSKDKGRELQATVLKAETFGSSNGIDGNGCVTEGISSFSGFWKQTTRAGGGCLRRGFEKSYVNKFYSEDQLVRLIMNYPNFGGGLSGFSNNLQGTPHGQVHNFINGNMAYMSSPDDPLFYLHHANVDRIWALYQDYYNQDRTAKDVISENCYSEGRDITLDTPLPFNEAGTYPSFFLRNGEWPTPRDVHHSMGDTVQVSYINDSLGRLLASTDPSYVAKNNQTWIKRASGPVDEVICSRRLEEVGSDGSSGNITVAEASNTLGISEDVPPFSNITTQLMWASLSAQGLPPQDILNTIAYRECEAQGNPLLASPEWIAMQGMENFTELFRCFNAGNPNDCIPDISIVSNDRRFDFTYKPIRIVSFNDTSVQFAMSQVWSSDTIDKVAVHYMGLDGAPHCDSTTEVFPGEFGVYEAKCTEGIAVVKLYANDPSIGVTAIGSSITKLCSAAGIVTSNSYVHSITLPCSLEGPQCPLPLASEPMCDGSANFAVATDVFNSNFNDTDSWVFSDISSIKAVGSFLELNAGTSKTYRVPATANSIRIGLEVYEIDCSEAANVTLLVGSVMVDLGVFDCEEHDGKSFKSTGGVSVDIVSDGARTDLVLLTVPPEFYKDTGRLPIGIRNSLIGIGSLTVTADCTSVVPVWQEPEVVSIIEQVVVP